MKSQRRLLIDAAKPIQPSFGSVIEKIERNLDAATDSDADASDTSWFEEHTDAVETKVLLGQILQLTSSTAFGASGDAMRLCTSSFARTECNVLYISRKLEIEELTFNLMAKASELDSGRLASGRLSDSEWDRLEFALKQINGQKFLAIHTEQIDIQMLHGWLEHASAKFNSIPLVVLDDALLLQGSGGKGRGAGQSNLFSLSRVVQSVDSLIVLVDQAWSH